MPWLVKAEPDSRVVKGVDVAFSIDEFEKLKTSHWDGVRNHQAKNFMKNDMKLNDAVLFYHSNTKIPGVAGIAHISKEGYPDHTAWDEKHPYYDSKSDENNPTWFMVDVTLDQRCNHLVPLKVLQTLATLSTVPSELSSYLKDEHMNALKKMVLLKRSRLSVQPVEQLAFEAVKLLGTNGGWSEDMMGGKKSGASKRSLKETSSSNSTQKSDASRSKKRKKNEKGDQKVHDNGDEAKKE